MYCEGAAGELHRPTAVHHITSMTDIALVSIYTVHVIIY